MSTSIIGFNVDSYIRFESDMPFEGKNIVPLENMTPKQRYELALDDDEDAVIYDNISTFLQELNDGYINSESYFFYEYSE